MRKLNPLYLAPLMAVMVAGCSDDDDDNGGGVVEPPIIEYSYVRVLHASPDAPLVNVTVDGANALAGVDYLEGSGFLELEAGMYDLGVDAILPDGMTATVIEAPGTDLMADTEYSIIALGKVADETLGPLVFARPTGGFGEGNIRLQVVHASPDTPAVDVYLTAPGDDIEMAEPTLEDVMFMDFSDLLEVPAGEYQARITLADSKDVAYDSGALDLAAGTDLALVAMNNTLTGMSPVVVGAWSGDAVALVPDVNAGAAARAIHASPDAPTVNVLADGVAILTDVSYTDVSDYLDVPAGDYELAVQDAATDEGSIPLFDGPVTLEQDTAYTVIAAGTLDETDDIGFGGIALVEERRRIATQASVRLVHGSAIAGNVDIYVTADGDISDDTPAFTDVPFGADTGQVALAGGDYYVTVTPTGSQDAAIGPLFLQLENNSLYTAIAADNIGGEALGVILADDFVVETGAVQVLHASPDAPLVNVTVNGENELTGVDYLAASGFSDLEPGTYTFGVDALLPGGETAEVIAADLPIEVGFQYSILATGKVGDGSLGPIVLAKPQLPVGSGVVRLQVVHASPDAPAVDVYWTAPDADISAVEPNLAGVVFGDASDLIEVPAGEYQARITPAGDKTVVYDSGALPVSAGTDLSLVAMNNTLTGESPVVVGALGEDGITLIPDVNAGAEARVLHISPDAPSPVNVLVNGEAAIPDVAFAAITPYVALPAGEYTLGVEDAAAPGTEIPLFEGPVALEQSVAYTVLAIGTVDDTDAFDFMGWAVMDDRRRVATEAKLRLLHASTTAGMVDIYLDDDGVIGEGEAPAFADVPFGAETGVIKLAEGDYFVTIAAAGTVEAAIGPVPVSLSAGGIYTAIAGDNAGVPDVLVTDDFVATTPVE